ncbi:hypothetical protein SAMN05216417_101483, partial [Nitrosospira multiformis]
GGSMRASNPSYESPFLTRQVSHVRRLVTTLSSAQGMRANFRRLPESRETHPEYLVELLPDGQLLPDSLLRHIERRSVHRRPLSTIPLIKVEKQALQDAVGESYTVRWFEGGAQRWRLAKLMFDNARLRLTLKEAYHVHRDIIEWKSRFSEDKVPDQALGLDAVTLKLMRWVMISWQRVHFFNTYLGGHLIPRLEMDLLPGLLCAAHFAFLARKAPVTIDDYVAAGRAVQRFWLTATSLGLGLQPELTPLIFSRYVREERRFSQSNAAWIQAQTLTEQLKTMLGDDTPQTVFLGRIGHGASPRARSLRLPLQRLVTFVNG